MSESNYLLFTPMLAEVASSGLEAQHISAPIRAACPHTRFHRAGVLEVDSSQQEKWLRKSEQGDKWNRCLIEGMIVLSETGARDEQTTPP